MFEVIPNWHPLFVHFSIALLTMSTIFFIALRIPALSSYKEQFKVLAFWNLRLGTGFAIITAIAGWFAYNSVAHDTASHLAMTDHRNWALVTLSVYILLTIWLGIKKEATMSFTIVMVLTSLLLVSTGWRGSEAVYRYGLGVMSLPQAEGDGHNHEHSTTKASVETVGHHPDNIGKPSHQEKSRPHDETPHSH